MNDRVQGLCPGCGNYFSVSITATDREAVCEFCGKPIQMVRHSPMKLNAVEADSVQSEITASPSQSGSYNQVGDEVEQTAASPATLNRTPRISSAWHEVATRDREAAMIVEAWEAFQADGWRCQDWPGHKAFSAAPPGGAGETEQVSVTVFASEGLLTLEVVVMAPPQPPMTDLRSMLARINVRTGGSVFLLRDCGVVARYKLIPRHCYQGRVAKAAVLRGLRQLTHDRLAAMPLIKEGALRMNLSNSGIIEAAYASPLAASEISQASPQYLLTLAQGASIRANAKGAMLYLGRQEDASDSYPVWFSISRGVVRGWTVPGSETGKPENTGIWGMLSRVVKKDSTQKTSLSRTQLDSLLKRLDALNETSALLNYVWNGKQILAMIVFPPTEKKLEPEEFEYMAEMLFERSRQGLRDLEGRPLDVPTLA